MKANKARKAKPKKASKKSDRRGKAAVHRTKAISTTKIISTKPISTSPHAEVKLSQPVAPLVSRPVFTIEIGTINGETTIGDLIVAFPRTRDVLMKHGLRFDVEDAGYLYMTLNVFSAIHGLTAHSLVQELHTLSKEPIVPPPAQQVRQLTPIPTA